MSLLHSRLSILLLLSGFLSCGQSATPQSTQDLKSSPLFDASRVVPTYFDLPMHLTPYLSGNFGELRFNHIHSGLDFKTLKGVGYPIYAVADGWVSRIRISNYGFGYALYIDHPNGFTTVYGHLQKYANPINTFAKKAQYHIENFELDTLLKPRVIPVKRGQLVAFSGNAGSSAAPHLHFEIRDTRTEEIIDPLLWYSDRIQDNIPPRFQRIVLYPLEGKGTLSTGINKVIRTTLKNSQGSWVLSGGFPSAWGKIGLGLTAYDYMNQTSNLYGVRNIRLFLENEEIFNQELSHFSFDQTRYVNSMTDYEAWLRNGIWILKSFREPGNRFNIYLKSKNDGYIDINEEKIYHLRYELEDRSGNTAEIRFEIQGKKTDAPVAAIGKNPFDVWKENSFFTEDFAITVPAGYLYKNMDFQFFQTPSEGYSDMYEFQNSWTPLHDYIAATFRIQRDRLANKNAYYLARKDGSGRFRYVGGKYVNGLIQAKIRDFGSYRVLADTIPPKIVGINLENAAKNRLFRIRISDDASGIKSWRGTIDGAWVLFEFDGKTSQLNYEFDDSRLKRGGSHQLILSVKDACGNENRLEKTFIY